MRNAWLSAAVTRRRPALRRSKRTERADQSDRDTTLRRRRRPSAWLPAKRLARVPTPVTTCATSPPQYQWIFKGACEKLMLKSTGANVQPANVRGHHRNRLDRTNNTSRAPQRSTSPTQPTTAATPKRRRAKPSPNIQPQGTSFIYAVAVNQSTQAIKPVARKEARSPVRHHRREGTPRERRAASPVSTESQSGKFIWTTLPGEASRPRARP